MIHHVSIPARDPLRVAAVLAELMNGRDFPFSGPLPGARMAMSGDPHGTMIEVYRDTITLTPGTDRGAPGKPSAFHLLEFRVENRIMLELAPAGLLAEYTGYMQIERMDAIMREPVAAAAR